MCNSVKLPPRRAPRQRQLSSLSSMLLAGSQGDPSRTTAATSVEKGSSSRTVETMLSDLSLKGSSLSSSSSEEKEENDKEDEDDAARTVSTNPARKLKSSHLIHHPQKGALLRMQKHGQKRVRFSHVEIREYPITLGDNPGGAGCGPPLTLEWEHQACHVWPHVQDYERARWATRRPNDSNDENDLVLTKAQRAHLLRHEFTYRDMYWASVDVKRIQLQRQQSAREHERWPAKASARARCKLQQWKQRLVKAQHAQSPKSLQS